MWVFNLDKKGWEGIEPGEEVCGELPGTHPTFEDTKALQTLNLFETPTIFVHKRDYLKYNLASDVCRIF